MKKRLAFMFGWSADASVRGQPMGLVDDRYFATVGGRYAARVCGSYTGGARP